MNRLDKHYWEDAGTVVGPPGVAAQALHGNTGFVYRSVYDYHLEPPSLPADLEVSITKGRPAIARLDRVAEQLPRVETGYQPNPETGLGGIDDASWMCVEASGTGDSYVFAVTCAAAQRDLATALTFVVSDSSLVPQPTRDSVWHVVLHELAKSGVVGLMAQYPREASAERYVKNLGFFQTVEDHVRERGLTERFGRMRRDLEQMAAR